MIKLVFPADGSSRLSAVDEIIHHSCPVEMLTLVLHGDPDPSWPGTVRTIEQVNGLPDFNHIYASLKEEQPDGCVLANDSIFSRLCSTAADLLSIPTILFVQDCAQLRNLPYHQKIKPDLFLLTSAKLFPKALEDPRYGSTLLPVSAAGIESASNFNSILERWAKHDLDPPNPDLTVIVPAFREAANVASVCARILSALKTSHFVWELLIVDDASPDDTYSRALDQMWHSPRIRALTKGTPRGMGNAIRHGLKAARAPIALITMGDGSDDVDRIPEMYAAIHDEGFALAIGTRYRRRENYANVPWLYRFWSRGFRLTSRFLTGLKLTDYTNAFRAFDMKIFARYGPESGGFEISPEITFKAWLCTRRVTEVDVRHLKRTAGQSTFSFLKAGPGYGSVLIKAVVGRFTGRWFSLGW